MNIEIYKELLEELTLSTKNFDGVTTEVAEEIYDDFQEIINSIDINQWEVNIDGTVKNITMLLGDLSHANRNQDKQKCIETVAMLRVAFSGIESAFSNTVDSMEKVVISIRDA